MVAFLCSERASYIAGRSITVDGPGARPARKAHATPHCLCYPEKEIGSAGGSARPCEAGRSLADSSTQPRI